MGNVIFPTTKTYPNTAFTTFSAEIFKQSSVSQVVCLCSQRQGFIGHLSFAFIATTFSDCGINFLSSVGPKITYVFVFIATATCNGAESEQINFEEYDNKIAKYNFLEYDDVPKSKTFETSLYQFPLIFHC